MVHCDKCNIEIPYLPFRCKYCGRYFCRDHRLPENHGCTGRFDAPIVVPAKVQKQMGIEIEEQELKRPRKNMYQDAGENPQNKKGLKFLKQRNAWFSSPKWRRFQESKFGQHIVTHSFLILFAIGFLLTLTAAAPYVVLDPPYFFFQYLFYTILTAVLVPSVGGGFWGILLVALFLYFFYMISRQMETRFGGKFVIKFVFVCGILTGVVFLLAVFLFSLIPGYELLIYVDYGIGTNIGFFLGIATFFAVMMPQQTLRLMLPPIQLKAKTIAIVFIAISVGMGFLYWSAYGFNPTASIYMCSGLADVGGALGGYLIAKYSRARFRARPPPVQFISQY